MIIPKRIKIEIIEFCGKYSAESKYIRTSYFDTEKEARKEHAKQIKAWKLL